MIRVNKLMALACVGIVGVGAAMAQVNARQSARRTAKATGLAIHLANDSKVLGYTQMTDPAGVTAFVSPRVHIKASDILASGRTSDGTGNISLTLTGMDLLPAAGEGARVAVFMDGQLVSISAISPRSAQDTLVLTGVTAQAAQQLENFVNPSPIGGPVLRVQSTQQQANPGGTVVVEVYLQGVPSLRGAQVALDATGGNSGRLELEDIVIDITRENFVFAAENALTAVDLYRGRAVTAPYTSSVSAMEPSYVATYTFRASPDAQGTFQIQIRTNADTALRTEGSNPISYQAGPAASVTIGLGSQRPSKR